MDWVVVGAGPAGILAVGRLLDAGVSAKSILWLDPKFQVGDFGHYWYSVPSNTQVSLFTKFLQATAAFHYSSCPKELTLMPLHAQGHCLLGDVVKPLQWVTRQLCTTVAHQKCQVQSLQQAQEGWLLTTVSQQTFSAKNIILATGAVPKKLSGTLRANQIELSTALNPRLLQALAIPKQHVAVFGASHSGVLAMKNLLEAGCRVTNFYRSPLKYALYQEDHIIYDNTGLKGSAARWAKENLHGQDVSGLRRYYLADSVQPEYFFNDDVICDYAVYATGFSPRVIPSPQLDTRCYDPHTGIIAPGLFGLGIAYPEATIDRYGIEEFNVGLFKFSNYLTRVLPLWLSTT